MKPLVWFYLPGKLVDGPGFWLARGPHGGEFVFQNCKDGWNRRLKYIGKIRYSEETAEPDFIAVVVHHTTGMPYPDAPMSKAEALALWPTYQEELNKQIGKADMECGTANRTRRKEEAALAR